MWQLRLWHLCFWQPLRAFWALSPREQSDQTFEQSIKAAGELQRSGESVGIKGFIEYEVRDVHGKVKESGVVHNTINSEALNETFNRLTATASGGAYDAIAALSVDAATDDPSDGVAGSSIADDLDGDSGTSGEQNPADGTATTDFATETGNGTVTVTFTAKADSVAIKQAVLTKANEDDTAQGQNPAIADDDILAYQDVPDVTLNSGDTAQYTWTLDVD